MKRLYILRHGKSDWDAAYGPDHERPLAPRGRRAARAVGRLLAELGQVPDGLVTSSAVRARTTLELAAEAGEWGRSIEVVEALYGASPAGVLEVVRAAPERYRSLVVAGHEPTLSALVGGLVGGAAVRMVTAALARVDLAVESWAEAELGRGVLAWLVTPKLLASGQR